MDRKFYGVIVLLLACQLAGPVCAARSVVADSTASDTAQKEHRIKRFIFFFDNRQERIDGETNTMNGIRLGLELTKMRYGLGFYSEENYVKLARPETVVDSFPSQVRLGYATIFAERILFRDFRWELSVPVSLGAGQADLRTEDFITGLDTETTKDVAILDLSLVGHYKVFSWVGLGTGVGYRFVGTSSSVVRRSYSNPYITFKLKLFLGYIYKGIFKPDKIRAEKAAYQQEKQEHRAARQQRKQEKQDAP